MTLVDRMQPVTTGVRMFVGPVQRDPFVPTPFNPSQTASFDVDAPPAPWLDLGRVDNFKRETVEELTEVERGAESVVFAQFRKKLRADVSFTFRTWGRLQMAVAGGGVLWNVFEGEGPAAAVLPGSDARNIILDESAAEGIRTGEMIVVDGDYTGSGGYVGLGFSAAYIPPELATVPDLQFTRRVSHNVASVRAVSGGVLELERPLPAGAPPLGVSLKKVLGFESGVGGLFRQVWSALFVEETMMGGRVFYYYPRLESQASGRETSALIAGDYNALLLDAHLAALPTTDVRDGASALCYRVYLPPSGEAPALR